MTSPDPLVEVVRLKLLAGLLPRKQQVVGWAGHGEGYPCDACGRRVTAAEVEYESDAADMPKLRFHLACFTLWAAEQQRVDAAPNAVQHILIARPQALCAECLATKASEAVLAPERGGSVNAVNVVGLDAFEVRAGRCGGCARHTRVVAYRFVQPWSAEAV